jgi:Predicted acyltransferases
VLAISLKRFTASPSAYVAYGLRRLFRLYPLLIATTAFAFFYAFAIHPHVARALFSPGFFGHYDEEVGPIKIAASFLGLIDKANPPTWSIFVELVASALLPAFVLFARDLRRAALLAGGLLVVSFAAYELPDNHVLLYRWPVFMVNFAVGILALYAAERLRAPLSRLPDLARLGATIALFLVLMNGRDLMDAAGYAYRGHADPVTNLFEMAVSFALIVLLLEAAPRVMASRPLKWLGDLSYGVYLIHFPMLFTLAGLSVILIGEDVLVAHAGGFMIAVAILAPAVTLAASALTWRYLEAPMISLGRRLSDAVSPPRRG